jgi:4-amino-4-deoxy-L-arabinose transferase-like glycosyltransferase
MRSCSLVAVPVIISPVLTRRPKGEQMFVPLLAGLCGLFFFYRLGAMALIGPDEPRYAQVAREMLARQDPITPTIGGYPWLEKPVLTYWLMALSMRAFGVNEFAARFPSALLATGVAFLLYGVGKRIHSPLYGLFAACSFIANPMAFGFARGATTDMPLSATLTAGLCFLFLASEEDRSRRRSQLFAAAGLCLGLAVLAKGLIGLFLPLLIMGSYLCVRRSMMRQWGSEFARGGLVCLLVCASWYGPIMAQHGWRFVQEFFVEHHFLRYTTGRFQHPGPFFYYLPVLLVGTFPWTPLLLAAVARLLRRRRDSREGGSFSERPLDRLLVFAALWIAWPFLFFSFSHSKLPGYLLPVLPAAAFLAASEGLRAWKADGNGPARFALRVLPLFFLAIAVSALVYAGEEFETFNPWTSPLFWVTFGSATLGIGLAVAARYRTLIVLALLTCVVLVPTVLTTFQPLIEKKESFRDLAEIALKELRPGEKLIGYGWFHHTLTFYTNARSLYDEHGRVRILFSQEELRKIVRDRGSVLVVAKHRHLNELHNSRWCEVELIGSKGGVVLLRVKHLN